MTLWGESEQERLRRASAIVVGAGALGSPAATHLVAAGVGRLGIVDPEPVVKLGALNSETEVDGYPVRLDGGNAEAIVAGADVVLECSGERATRELVNDACCSEGAPLVVGAVSGLAGLVMSIRPGRSACYRCAGAETPGGGPATIGAAGGVVGSVQALEALKLLSGVGEPLADRVLHVDLRDMSQTVVDVGRRAECPACARVPAAAQSL